MTRGQHAIDAEVFPNFALVGVLDLTTGQTQTFSTEDGIGDTFDAFRQWCREHAGDVWVGFNTLSYDNFILKTIFDGGVENPFVNGPITDILYAQSGYLINQKKDWDQQKSVNGEMCVDLLAINGGAKKQVGSLKEAGCKLDVPSLQELPFAFDLVLTHDQMLVVAAYNQKDLLITARAHGAQLEKIRMRLALADEYGLPEIASAHDPKIAELVMAKELFGRGKPPKPTTTKWTLPTAEITSRFTFRQQNLRELLDRIPPVVEFEVTEELAADGKVNKSVSRTAFSTEVKVDDVTYTIGYGGFHSQDAPGRFVADDKFTFWDVDLESCYPAIILANRIVPEHLPADEFLRIYAELRERRLQAKLAGDTNLSNGLKIAINSIYGKSGSPYSWLFDPNALVRTTLLCQLTALSLIDELSVMPGVEVISGNTDGMMLKIRREQVDEVKNHLNAATATLGFTLSWEEFRLIARRDINNYIAVPTNGGPVKRKGAYGHNREDLGKKADNRIVKDAAVEYFVNDTPVADTIRSCSDIREFIDYFQANKGYTIVDGSGNDLRRVVRWYIGTSGVKLNKMKDGKLTQLVASGAVVIPDLPEQFPTDVNFEHYIAMANQLVEAITEPDIKYKTTIPIADLNQDEIAHLKTQQSITEADLDRCAALDLARYHVDWANVVAGTPYDTMKRLLVRMWISQQGKLTYGDLVWVADLLDEAEDRLPKKKKQDIARWVAHKVSPFPRAQTTAEHVARAMLWAEENVKPNPKRHRTLQRSDFVKARQKARSVYALACSICATNVRNGRPLSKAAICRIIDPDDAPPDPQPTIPESPDQQPSAPPPGPQPSAPLGCPAIWVDSGSWDESSLPKRRWIVPGYLLRGAISLISGPAGALKSTVMLGHGCSIVLKVNYGRFHPVVQGPVVIYNVEDDQDEQRRRLSAVLRQFNATPADLENQLIRIGPQQVGTLLARDDNGQLVFTEAMLGIEEIIQFYRPVAFICDPLAELHVEEENDNIALRSVIAQFRTQARDRDVATCLAHHTRKGSGASPGDQDTARGASAIMGAVRTAFTLTGMSEADAQALGVPADAEARSGYARLDYAKANYTPVLNAEWFQKVPYTLANGEVVPAAEPWIPPAAKVATQSDLAALAAAIQVGAAGGLPWSPKLSKDARSVGSLLTQFGYHGAAQKDTVSRLHTESGMATGQWQNADRHWVAGLRIDGKPAVKWKDT